MRLIHLSDLHIGKRVNGFSMIEDQKFILDQIIQMILEHQVEAVLIAGDVYDKAVPSAEAVNLFNSFLNRLADCGQKVFVISGNHDSQERLAFGSLLMQEKGFYFTPVYDGTVTRIALEDAYGPVYVHLLPFLKPAWVRALYPEEACDTSQHAVETALCHAEVVEGARNVILAHQFVAGAGCCDSEEMAVGGIDQIDAALFDAFDYVALGHIHGPQKIKRDTLRYCGTPLAYSFSEAGQEKSAVLVDLLEKGNVKLTKLPFKPLRKMRKIRGSFYEVTARSFYSQENQEDYVQVTLTDEEDILDGVAKLRVIYPNLMELLYDNCRTRTEQQIEADEAVEEKLPIELVQDFYMLQNNQPMSEAQEQLLDKLIEKLQEDEG